MLKESEGPHSTPCYVQSFRAVQQWGVFNAIIQHLQLQPT